MNKLLTTFWLAWMLAWSPSGNAQVDSTRAEINENLVEIMTKEQETLEEDETTISFEGAKKMQEQQFFERIMNDEKIQELVKKYWQKKMETIVNLAISHESTLELFEDSLIKEADTGRLVWLFLLWMWPIIIEMASAAGNPDVQIARAEEKDKQRERDRKWAELFDDSETKKFQKELKENTKKFKNFIKIMENTKKEKTEIMWFPWNNVHVELPALWSFNWFKFDYFVSDLSFQVDENDIKNNPELEQRLYSKSEIWEFMSAMHSYMKECWIDDLSSWISWGNNNSDIYIFLEDMLNLNHLENYILQNKDKNHHATWHPRLHHMDKESESFGWSEDWSSYRFLLKLND